MNEELEKKLHIGLTSEEVQLLTEQGLVNGDLDVKTKTYKQIIKDNLFTLFNLVNTILAVCIAIVGSWKNGLFFLVVIHCLFDGGSALHHSDCGNCSDRSSDQSSGGSGDDVF